MRSCGPLCPPLQNKIKNTNQRTGAFSYSQTSRFCLTFSVILLSTSPQNGTKRVPVQREREYFLLPYWHSSTPEVCAPHRRGFQYVLFSSVVISMLAGFRGFFLPLNSSLVVYNPAEARHKKRPFRHQSLSSSVPFLLISHRFIILE